MAANMYRVGDYVFFESSSTSPYTIRRIEELSKTQNGNVEAKVMCFYRRRDISNTLILLADKHHSNQMEDEQDHKDSSSSEPSSPDPEYINGIDTKDATSTDSGTAMPPNAEPRPFCDVPDKQRHQLKHRELFLSRQVETLPATHIRGKCVVTLLNETENLLSYISKEDTFFYSLVYDPQQKTLLADKGDMRVGSKFQAEIQPLLRNGELNALKAEEDLEMLVWKPDSSLSKKEIDQFLVVARSVGTFARALDSTSTVRQPSLHMSAAAASRDITLFHAMNTLHKHSYDCSKAIRSLVPDGGPVLCRDEMEEWSASEANLFEEALDKYGKDFMDIRLDFLPWKSLKSIVEYYYMWKTTDRYVQQKRIKAAEAESKLKQVYIPNYNKPSPAAIIGKSNGQESHLNSRTCESCYTAHSSQWFSWGPGHMQCRLCSVCWIYWKKYGGLKMPTRLGGQPLQASRLLQELLSVQHGAHWPHKFHVHTKMWHQWLFKGSAVERAGGEQMNLTNSFPSIMKKRAYEQSNGLHGLGGKRPCMGLIRQAASTIKSISHSQRVLLGHGSVNGRARVPALRGSKMHMISWLDMPDDVFFYATDATRNIRKQLHQSDFKRSARNPWRELNVKSCLPVPSLATAYDLCPQSVPSSHPMQEVVVLD